MTAKLAFLVLGVLLALTLAVPTVLANHPSPVASPNEPSSVIPTSNSSSELFATSHPAYKGDVNADGVVDQEDLRIIAQAIWTDLPVDPAADVNGDGRVTFLDFVEVAQYFSIAPVPYSCDEISDVSTVYQLRIVEGDLSCAATFVDLLVAQPWSHLEAFYHVIPSPTAGDAVWDVVYDELRFGLFQFEAAVVDDLQARMPDAIAACTEAVRCPDWEVWILPGAFTGGMYLCPALEESGRAALLASILYGGYYCTEDTATALAPLAKTGTITKILKIIRNHPNGWSRRNGIRVLGRMAERPAGDSAHILVTETKAEKVQATLTSRLRKDRYPNVLHDAIWVLDSFFYPYFEMQPRLEDISADAEFYSDLRFRAMAAFARLIWQKQGLLPAHDLDFILGSLESDDVWIRAEAAYISETFHEEHLDDAGRTRVEEALNAAWDIETELIAKVFIARALDFYNGTTILSDQLRSDYESDHLANVATGDGITIRSGLPNEELSAFVSLMEYERSAFFDIMGQPFDIPLTGDTNDSMTLILFATLDEYREYMNSFVGFGGYAGGLYLEGSATLYTYQRTPQQSVFTVEQLIKHEFGHYLQGRYVYPD